MPRKYWNPIRVDQNRMLDMRQRRFTRGEDLTCRPRGFVKHLNQIQTDVSSVVAPTGLYAKAASKGEEITSFRPLLIEEGDKPNRSPNMLRVIHKLRRLVVI